MTKHPLYVGDTGHGATAPDVVQNRQPRRDECLIGGVSPRGLSENDSVFAEFVIRGPQRKIVDDPNLFLAERYVGCAVLVTFSDRQARQVSGQLRGTRVL